MLKKLIAMLLMSIMVLSGTVMSFAEEDLSERADTTHRNEFRNKAYLGYTIEKGDYYSSSWLKTENYDVNENVVEEISLRLKGTLSSYLNELVGTGIFEYSYTSETGYTANVPANPNKYSKLQLSHKYARYYGDLYYIIDYGSYESSRLLASGDVEEPTGDTYLDVVYQ